MGTLPVFKPRSLAILPFPLASDKLALQAKLSRTLPGGDATPCVFPHASVPSASWWPFLMQLHLVPPSDVILHKMKDIPI